MEQPTQREYSGSPSDIGCSIFIDLMMPIIEQVGKQPSASAESMAKFYAGMTAALGGCITADFDKATAMEILRGTADNLERANLTQEAAKQH